MKGLMILTLLFIVACDAPVRGRYLSGGPGGGPYYSDGDGSSSGGDNGSGGSGFTDQETGNHSSSQEPGYEDCNLGHRYHGALIGAFGICQNSYNQKQIKVSMAQADVNDGTCFVPMRILENGSSYNLGRAECVHHQAGKTYYATLNTFRYDPVNGIMVIKASSVNDFMKCMGAKNDFMLGKVTVYDQQRYGSACLQNPDAYASCVCNRFVQEHGQKYKQVKFN